MKKTNLTKLPIVPEKYDLSHFEKIDYSKLHSSMFTPERRFINGLIRYYEPQNVLEVGVYRGGSTVNLLNAMSDIPQSKLISIDRAVQDIGIDVLTVFSPLPQLDKWELITGKDPSDCLDELPYKYDFAIIDTAHLHPIESLNFLCVLPYLNDGAIVVLHDVAWHLLSESPNYYATRILMSSIVAPKLTHTFPDPYQEPNIIAFQVTDDTHKYIDNVFDSLFLPWGMFPEDDIKSIECFLENHYAASQIEKFHNASAYNAVFVASGCTSFNITQCKEGEKWKASFQESVKIYNTVVFYGAGQNLRRYFVYLLHCHANFNFLIWDRNACNIGDIFGIPVYEPDFENKASGDKCLVITILNQKIAQKVKLQFECLGYRVFISVDDFLTYHENLN